MKILLNLLYPGVHLYQGLVKLPQGFDSVFGTARGRPYKKITYLLKIVLLCLILPNSENGQKMGSFQFILGPSLLESTFQGKKFI